LATIIHRKKAGWLAALENQKPVYLITDKKTGKLYVGSATAQYGMLLQRWSSYVENGHGGNVELKQLKKRDLITLRKTFNIPYLRTTMPEWTITIY
jgi:hypothetical protein